MARDEASVYSLGRPHPDYTRTGLLAFIQRDDHEEYEETPVWRFFSRLLPFVVFDEKNESGDRVYRDPATGKSYYMQFNTWSHNFNRWFAIQRKAGKVSRDACISYLERKIARNGY